MGFKKEVTHIELDNTEQTRLVDNSSRKVLTETPSLRKVYVERGHCRRLNLQIVSEAEEH